MAQKPMIAQEGLGVTNDSGDTYYLRGTADPSQSPGVEAPISSQYNRDDGTNSCIWLKTGAADTDWVCKSSESGIIGSAEDGDYTDGLFTDFTADTPTGTPIDRFNEVLKALAPPPAPSFSDITYNGSGEVAKLAFGSSHAITGYSPVGGEGVGAVLDQNDTYPVSGQARGCYAVGHTPSGVLAGSVAAHAYSYPADAFGDGDQGTLKLEVNGVVIHTVDLTAFSSGASVNGNGSGFTLSAANAVEFDSGDAFVQFQYRTGTWTIAVADQRNGHNYVRVSHEVSAINRWSDYFEWVIDADVTTASASGAVLDTLSMVGSKFLSGIEYHTDGTAQYDVVLNDVHRNLYSSSGSAVTFSESNCQVVNRSLGAISDESDTEVITNTVATINSNIRLLAEAISVAVNCAIPVQTNLSSQGSASITGLLLDDVDTSNTDVRERFCLEDRRLMSVAASVNDYDAQADIASGTWDSTESLAGATLGYAEGLLVYDGAVRYPRLGVDAGDFRNAGDGNANGATEGPSGNPNYNAVTGIRYYYRKFTNNSGLTKANFRVRLTGAGNFVAVGTGPSAQNLTLEMKFPDGAITSGTGFLDAYGDFATGQFGDGDGARNATGGTGRSMGDWWGMTVGTLSIAAGESVILRVASHSGWTGNISDITLEWV